MQDSAPASVGRRLHIHHMVHGRRDHGGFCVGCRQDLSSGGGLFWDGEIATQYAWRSSRSAYLVRRIKQPINPYFYAIGNLRAPFLKFKTPLWSEWFS